MCGATYKQLIILLLTSTIFARMQASELIAAPVITARYDDIHKKGSVEHVTFYARKNDHDAELIARKGILVVRPQAQATILICHGFLCNKQDVAFLRMMFTNVNIMTFDFRAHGEDIDGHYSTLGIEEAHDVIAAAQFLKSHQQINSLPLIVYGFSMGAVAAIEAQAKHHLAFQTPLFKAMILDCPFDSTENLVKRGLENLRVSLFGYNISMPGRGILQQCAFYYYTQTLVQFLLRIFAGFDAHDIQVYLRRINTQETVKNITVPCFFIHCINDEKVPFDQVKITFEKTATPYKKLWLTGGRRHYDSIFNDPERYAYNVEQFIKRVVNDDMHFLGPSMIIDESAEESFGAYKDIYGPH